MTSADKSKEIEDLRNQIQKLETRLNEVEQRDRIFEKAFRVLGLHTNYAEFGVYKGDSIIQAYYSAKKVYDELTGGRWNHSFPDHEKVLSSVKTNWDNLKFFAFDSFEGMPPTTGPDKEMEFFSEGTYKCSQADFIDHVTSYGVPLNKLPIVPGFFDESCTPENVQSVGFQNIGIVNIDSDLYESAKVVLEFITPYLSPNSIIIFDEWFQFLGNPSFGEQRAFSEWRREHPEFQVTEFHREGAFRMSFILTRQ